MSNADQQFALQLAASMRDVANEAGTRLALLEATAPEGESVCWKCMGWFPRSEMVSKTGSRHIRCCRACWDANQSDSTRFGDLDLESL